MSRSVHGVTIGGDIIPAALLLSASSQHPLTVDAVRQALRDRGIAGVVAEPAGSISARVAVTLDGDMVVTDAGGRLAATAAQPVVDALAALWHADVVLETPTGLAAAASGLDDSEGTAPTPTTPDVERSAVYVIGGAIPVDRTRRLELAPQLEASVSVLATEDAHLLVGHSPVRDYWPPAQRPVVALRREGGSFTLQVFTTAGLSGDGMRDRLAMRGIPDISVVWTAGWREVLDDGGGVADVQAMLRRGWVVTGTASSSHPDLVGALAELGIDTDELDRLVLLENDGDLASQITRALHLPRATAEIVDGRVRIDDLPGAQHIERTGVGRIVWEQVMTPPTGSSLWARWRQLPLTRPRLAMSLTVGEGLLTIALIATLVVAPPVAPWGAILWVVAAVLIVDVGTDIILLRGLRCRRG